MLGCVLLFDTFIMPSVQSRMPIVHTVLSDAEELPGWNYVKFGNMLG